MTSSSQPDEIRAAGGLVVRRRGGTTEILLVHRPKYQDWSLPKGKLDGGESFSAAALREVEEETGVRCRLDRELETVRYLVGGGRPKVVRYWLMQPMEGRIEDRSPDHEVDQVRWATPSEARRLLTYPFDLALLDQIDVEGEEKGA